MKKKLGIIQILAILIIGIMLGAFAERGHVFGYADNTSIIPSGEYKTTNTNWGKIKIKNFNFQDKKGHDFVIIDNRFTNRKNGRLVLASKHAGNRSWSYYVTKIDEGWKMNPVINGKANDKYKFIVYAN
ncbi:hypothetical protein KGP39_03090 [Weissella hellenica]|nr:hypothetical protein [Weissella hellenica]